MFHLLELFNKKSIKVGQMKNRRSFIKTVATGCLAASIAPLSVHGMTQDKTDQEKDPVLVQDDRAKKAQAMMAKYGSCCTGVLAAYAEELGMDVELAARTGRGMAGGIGSMGHVCGAVSGAAMVIGLKTTDNNNIHNMQAGLETMDTVKQFITRFEEKHKSIQCRELTGHDLSTMEAMKVAMKENAFANCPTYVEDAVLILEEMFAEEPA